MNKDEARRMAEEVELPESKRKKWGDQYDDFYMDDNGTIYYTEAQVREAIAAALVKLTQEQEQEPVAWRTFDGEGGYDYRSYEGNENYRDEFIKSNGQQYTKWVELLTSLDAIPGQQEELLSLQARNQELADRLGKQADVLRLARGALEACTTEEGPEQQELNDARDAIDAINQQLGEK